MRLWAIDPGPNVSSWTWYECSGVVGTAGRLLEKMLDMPNKELLSMLRETTNSIDHLVVEQISGMGMPVGEETFETVYWTGRFVEAAQVPFDRMPRYKVKMELCGSTKAKDGNIRQRLIDLYGPSDAKAVGKKASPGPLFGVSYDVWQALGLAVAFDWAHPLQVTLQ